GTQLVAQSQALVEELARLDVSKAPQLEMPQRFKEHHLPAADVLVLSGSAFAVEFRQRPTANGLCLRIVSSVARDFGKLGLQPETLSKPNRASSRRKEGEPLFQMEHRLCDIAGAVVRDAQTPMQAASFLASAGMVEELPQHLGCLAMLSRPLKSLR